MEYFAFISYNRKDEKEAEWLQHQLEHYHLPTNIADSKPNLPKSIRPLFRDKTELAGGFLNEEIVQALTQSQYLIVICSINSSKSEWVNKEVSFFINSGRTDKIIPYIISGTPYSSDKEQECFVPALIELKGTNRELLAINISETSHEVASIKVVARMLGLKFNTLWQRYEREKEEERQNLLALNNRILKNQARFISEKATQLVEEGNSYLARLLLHEVLPTSLHPNYPYTIEAEVAFRKACSKESAVFCGHLNCINFVSCSKDGRYILSASDDWSVRLWETKTGKCLRIFEGHNAAVNYVAFLPDNERFLTASDDCTLRIWNLDTGECLNVLKGHTRPIYSACINEKNNIGISVSRDKTIRIWNLDTGAQVNLLTAHKSPISSVACSKDGKYIVSGSWDKTVKLWDSKTGICIRTFEGHNSNVASVCINNKLNLIVSVSWDKNIRVWDINTGECVHEINHKHDFREKIIRVSFNHDETQLIASEALSIHIWKANERQSASSWFRNDQSYWEHTLEVDHSMTFSSFYNEQSNMIVFCEGNNIHIKDLGNLGRRYRSILSPVESNDYSEFYKTFINEEHDILVELFMDNRMMIYDLDQEKLIFNNVINLHVDSIIFIEGHPFVVGVTCENTIEIHECITNNQTIELHGHEGTIKDLCFSPSKNILFTYSNNGILYCWDISKEEMLWQMEFKNIERMCISSCGRYWAFMAKDRNAVVITDFQNDKNIMLEHPFLTNDISFSTNGKLFVTQSYNPGSIRIWNVESGNIILEIKDDDILGYRGFSIDTNGKYIIVKSMTDVLYIYEIASGKCIEVLDDFHDCQFFFACNDSKVIICEDSSTICYDFMSLDKLVESSCSRFRDVKLSPTERSRYYIE